MVFYTQVWLFSNIFAKSQTCVEKNYHVSLNIPLSFFDGDKDLAHFSTFFFIYFHFPLTFSLILFFTCRVVTFANTSSTTIFFSIFPPFLEMTDFSTSKILEPDMRSLPILNVWTSSFLFLCSFSLF